MGGEAGTRNRGSILDWVLLFSWIAGYAVLLGSFRLLQYLTSRGRGAARADSSSAERRAKS